jgi:hypothetical protein
MTADTCRNTFKLLMTVPDADLDRYEWIRILRLSIILFSAVFLVTNIVIILRSIYPNLHRETIQIQHDQTVYVR